MTVLALLAAWFRQVREEQGQPTLPSKNELLRALQRLPISFGMARRTHDTVKKVRYNSAAPCTATAHLPLQLVL